jgi:hypothetical protein
MRAKTRTEDGLVHGVTEVGGKRNGRPFAVCGCWGAEDMPNDAPVTCFECIDSLDKMSYIDRNLTEALKQYVGTPMTEERQQLVNKVIQDVLDGLKKR